ncbi:antibiotic biosynthesis monooxygenase [Ancylobacter amanitiformis]|uniref:Antibiotic biosynthesis monooxygenase (ABM) superfamily enzyme n=1 Tax=Ancylobacter amanitiformis TaxID=217069 RepID=A0ABU0LKK1_9HYPH|nr:antibiotic biosynthesis monooxygenase [Ancylobacter amanitiformis]MDQ0509230.1 antibiotic biosynthesis monooxygenase (ABM) superfamily enzyme [Ancylobacter amanitiformis]
MTTEVTSRAVSAVATRILVRPGMADRFADWQARFTRTASLAPGFLNVEILPAFAGSGEWQIVQRFVSHETLEHWLDDAVRRALLDDLAPLRAPEDPALPEEVAPDYHAFATVTEVITTQVEPGREAEFFAWSENMQAAQAKFPGYMGTLVQAPVSTDLPCWTALVRFASPAELDAWLVSAERRDRIAAADPAVSHWSNRRLAAGFAAWFAPDASGNVPPAWKQTALVLLVLFPVVMLEIRFLSPLLTGLPMALATFLGNAISVCLVSWPLVGLARAGMMWWLRPAPTHRRAVEIGGALTLAALYGAEMGLLSLLF